MPTVFLNEYQMRFHRAEDCDLLQKSKKIETADLRDLDDVLPCRKCYPDAPRAVSAHRYCFTCDTGRVKPCEHNGGVLVRMTRSRRTTNRRLFQDPGETYTRDDYVWPEKARHYLIVALG